VIARVVERPDLTPRPRVPRKAGTFGDRLTTRRLAVGLTQRELAELAGITSARVAHLECDYYGTGPTAYTLAALAKALGVRMDWLWSGDDAA
jgi:transcriptional regulator with XRE-family HTH domain